MCDSIHSPKFGSVEAFLEEDVPLKMMEQSVGPSLEEIEYWRGVDQTANAMMTTTTPDSKERRSVTEEMEVESRLERHKQQPRQRKKTQKKEFPFLFLQAPIQQKQQTFLVYKPCERAFFL